MLYRYVWGLLYLVYRGIFKRAFYNNLNVLEKNKAYILASNHCNAFLDPVVVAAQINRSCNFLVRSDVFNTPIKRFFLQALHQIPIFRGRDGVGNIKEKNEETFSKVYEILEDKRLIMIYPEGDCVPEKRLRPLKKGTARMAFGVMTKNNWQIDPYILPLAVNYTYHTQLRTELMVGFDQPIRIKDYQDLYFENEAKAINKLTEDIAKGIKRQLIEIPKHLDKETEVLLQIFRSKLKYSPFTWRRNNDNRLFKEQALAKDFASIENEKPQEFEIIQSKIIQYQNFLNQNKITDKGFYLASKKKSNDVGSYLLYPIFILGYLINKPLKNYIEKTVRKNIKKDEFKLSIIMGFLLAIYHVLALVIFLLMSFFFGVYWGVLSLVLLYLSSWCATLLKENYDLNNNLRLAKKFKVNNPSTFEKYFNLRNEIKEKFEILK